MFLEIVSPEASLFKGEVSSITVPGVEGSFQMLNNHAPIVSLLQAGNVSINGSKFEFSKHGSDLFRKINDQNYSLSISSGTVEMKDNKVIILVD